MHTCSGSTLRTPECSAVASPSREAKQETPANQDALWVLLLRYYFKKASDEFACGAVFEEIWDDEAVLPMYEGRILGKVERID